MDIVFVNDDGEPIVRLHDEYMLNSPVWVPYHQKFNKFTAYCDLIFQADEEGHLRTTTRKLSERWCLSRQTVRYLLKKYRDFGFIITSHDQHYTYITIVFEPLKPYDRYQPKISECRYPEKHGCRGCKYNHSPELFDGGCKLIHNHYPIDK